MSRFLLFLFGAAAIGAIALSGTAHGAATKPLWIVAGVALLLWLSFLPTFIAYEREHPNRVPILLLNLFLGWTFLGWVGALIWACLAIPEPPPARGFADNA